MNNELKLAKLKHKWDRETQLIATGKDILLNVSSNVKDMFASTFNSPVSATAMTVIILTPFLNWLINYINEIKSPPIAELTPYAKQVLASNKEAVSVLNRIHYLDSMIAAPGITDYARDVLRREITRLQAVLDEIYRR